MARENNVIVDYVWAALANTIIPPNPTPGVYYRNDAVPSGEIENGQGFGNILDSATYNQVLFLLSSVAKTLCENGIMPYQTGQAYVSGALCLYTDGNIYRATRAILASESPYPYPGDGTGAWADEPSTMTGATAILPGAKGLVPAPAAGDQDKVLAGDGTWKTVAVANMVGATNSLPGTAGLVPAPPAGSVNLPLCGDGTFKSAIGASAAKLTTARTIALSGNATGSASFDGSSNVTINTTVNQSANATNAVTAQKANKLTTARTIALSGHATGSAAFDGSGNVTINANVNYAANAANATKASQLATARTISLSGNATGSVSFNGTSNVTIPTTVNYAATAGTASKANQLATARTIALTGKASGSASFSGAANATINVTNVYPTIRAAIIGTVIISGAPRPAVLVPAGGTWWCHGHYYVNHPGHDDYPETYAVNGLYSGGSYIVATSGVSFGQSIICIKVS